MFYLKITLIVSLWISHYTTEYYTMSSNPPWTIYDRNAKSQRVLTELRTVDSE